MMIRTSDIVSVFFLSR